MPKTSRVAPTTDHSELDKAINNLSTHLGTAIGTAVLQALNAIASINPAVRPVRNTAELGVIGDFGPGSQTPDHQTADAGQERLRGRRRRLVD